MVSLEAWSCLFAPLGASVRWGLSLLLPKVAEWMPWRGTWAAGLPMHTWMANVLGKEREGGREEGGKEGKGGVEGKEGG